MRTGESAYKRRETGSNLRDFWSFSCRHFTFWVLIDFCLSLFIRYFSCNCFIFTLLCFITFLISFSNFSHFYFLLRLICYIFTFFLYTICSSTHPRSILFYYLNLGYYLNFFHIIVFNLFFLDFFFLFFYFRIHLF